MAEEGHDKSVQFITKLVQLTQDGNLRWTPTPAVLSSANSSAFSTVINDRKLRIYLVQPKFVGSTSALATILGTDSASRKIAVLELLDDFEQPVYSFERIAGLEDLYRSASFSASGVDDLINSVLER
ncbi:MAG TPA: hypothetical protein PL193_03895 [Xanthobacteraceae bacterium]|nr:hypothetical protein [Xanthobacteraceae bacterium]